VQEDLLKEKELEILSLKKSQAKEVLILDELTRESFLAKDACNKLEGEKLQLQKSFESLRASHIALEVQLENLKNNATTTSNDALSSSKASIRKGCSRCYKIDINACGTNIAEMSAMKKEIPSLMKRRKNPRAVSLTTIPKALGQAT
jgi:Na+-translocating ferredoxin:NAD+ oxidoreductase RNF subunit RnfB